MSSNINSYRLNSYEGITPFGQLLQAGRNIGRVNTPPFGTPSANGTVNQAGIKNFKGIVPAAQREEASQVNRNNYSPNPIIAASQVGKDLQSALHEKNLYVQAYGYDMQDLNRDVINNQRGQNLALIA